MFRVIAITWLMCTSSPGQIPDAFTMPIELATSQGDVVGAAVVVDDTAGYHVMWVDADGDLNYRGGRLGFLAPPRVLVSADRNSSAGDVAGVATSTGGPAIAWSLRNSASDDSWDIYYRLSPSLKTIRLMGDAFADRNPTLATRGDSLYLAWERRGPQYEIDYSVIVRNDLPLRLVLSRHDVPATRPRLARGAGDLVWVVWTVHAASGGETWIAGLGRDGIRIAPRAVRAGADDRHPSIAVSATGRPHIVWQQGESAGAIAYSYGLLDSSGELTGFAPVRTLTDRLAANPSIAIMDDGVPSVTWSDAATGTLQLVSVIGNDVIGPLLLATPEFEPNRTAVNPGYAVTPTGALISPFIGTSPSTSKRGIWIAFFGEAPTATLVWAFEAYVEKSGAVRLSWRGDGDLAIDSFTIVRTPDGIEGGERVTLATVHVGESVAGSEEFELVDNAAAEGEVYSYRIEALDADGHLVSAREVTVSVPITNADLVVRATPNPFNASTSFMVWLPGAGSATVRIVDCSGRFVREWDFAAPGAGSHRFVWDGRDGAGRNVGSGVYLAHSTYRGADGSVATWTLRVTLLR